MLSVALMVVPMDVGKVDWMVFLSVGTMVVLMVVQLVLLAVK